jgi:hypothetical protein
MSDCSSAFRAFTPLSSQTTARPRTAGTSFGSQTRRPADGSRATPPGPLDATNEPQRRGGYTIRRFSCGTRRASRCSRTRRGGLAIDTDLPISRTLRIRGTRQNVSTDHRYQNVRPERCVGCAPTPHLHRAVRSAATREDGLATGPVVDSVGYGTELARVTRTRPFSWANTLPATDLWDVIVNCVERHVTAAVGGEGATTCRACRSRTAVVGPARSRSASTRRQGAEFSEGGRAWG